MALLIKLNACATWATMGTTVVHATIVRPGIFRQCLAKRHAPHVVLIHMINILHWTPQETLLAIALKPLARVYHFQRGRSAVMARALLAITEFSPSHATQFCVMALWVHVHNARQTATHPQLR